MRSPSDPKPRPAFNGLSAAQGAECLSYLPVNAFPLCLLPALTSPGCHKLRPDNIRPILPHTGCKLKSQFSGSAFGVCAGRVWNCRKQLLELPQAAMTVGSGQMSAHLVSL